MFEGYLTWYTTRYQRKRGRPPAESTMRTKRHYLATVARVTGLADEVSLGTSLSERSTVEHLLDMLAAHLSPGALRQAFYVLQSYGEYARLKGWGEPQLRKDDAPGGGGDKPIVVYSKAEVDLLVNCARPNLRWWAFLSFLAETGRRVGEALSLRWDQLRLDADVPYFELPSTKNGDPQYIPLTSFLKESVFTAENIAKMKATNRAGRNGFHRDPTEWVFPWTYSTVHAMFGRHCERLGVTNRGFHNFRHTVITNRIASGIPIQAVAALAGHRTPAITLRRYNHANALDYVRYVN